MKRKIKLKKAQCLFLSSCIIASQVQGINVIKANELTSTENVASENTNTSGVNIDDNNEYSTITPEVDMPDNKDIGSIDTLTPEVDVTDDKDIGSIDTLTPEVDVNPTISAIPIDETVTVLDIDDSFTTETIDLDTYLASYPNLSELHITNRTSNVSFTLNSNMSDLTITSDNTTVSSSTELSFSGTGSVDNLTISNTDILNKIDFSIGINKSINLSDIDNTAFSFLTKTQPDNSENLIVNIANCNIASFDMASSDSDYTSLENISITINNSNLGTLLLDGITADTIDLTIDSFIDIISIKGNVNNIIGNDTSFNDIYFWGYLSEINISGEGDDTIEPSLEYYPQSLSGEDLSNEVTQINTTDSSFNSYIDGTADLLGDASTDLSPKTSIHSTGNSSHLPDIENTKIKDISLEVGHTDPSWEYMYLSNIEVEGDISITGNTQEDITSSDYEKNMYSVRLYNVTGNGTNSVTIDNASATMTYNEVSNFDELNYTNIDVVSDYDQNEWLDVQDIGTINIKNINETAIYDNNLHWRTVYADNLNFENCSFEDVMLENVHGITNGEINYSTTCESVLSDFGNGHIKFTFDNHKSPDYYVENAIGFVNTSGNIVEFSSQYADDEVHGEFLIDNGELLNNQSINNLIIHDSHFNNALIKGNVNDVDLLNTVVYDTVHIGGADIASKSLRKSDIRDLDLEGSEIQGSLVIEDTNISDMDFLYQLKPSLQRFFIDKSFVRFDDKVIDELKNIQSSYDSLVIDNLDTDINWENYAIDFNLNDEKTEFNYDETFEVFPFITTYSGNNGVVTTSDENVEDKTSKYYSTSSSAVISVDESGNGDILTKSDSTFNLTTSIFDDFEFGDFACGGYSTHNFNVIGRDIDVTDPSVDPTDPQKPDITNPIIDPDTGGDGDPDTISPIDPEKPVNPDDIISIIEDPIQSAIRAYIPYIQGYPDGDIHPNAYITRGEVMQVMYNLYGYGLFADGYKYHESLANYTDVSDSDWFADGVAFCSDIGVVNGYTDGTMRPNDPITRAELATILSRFVLDSEYSYAHFTDIDEHWAEDAINKLYDNGIINGYEDGSFSPDKNTTRTEFVTMVNRLEHRPAEHYNSHVYSDLPESFWGYDDMMNAANGAVIGQNLDKDIIDAINDRLAK